MDVEFKLYTYREPIETEEQKYIYAVSRNRTAYYPTIANFLYNMRNKTIYEGISCSKYRSILHEDILSLCGFNFEDDVPEYFIRFEFDTLGYYNFSNLDLGTYSHCELGVPGLVFSGIYYDIPKHQKRADNLKAYDMDILESYINSLKREQAQIRATEVNLNFRKEPRPRRRQFSNVQQDKK